MTYNRLFEDKINIPHRYLSETENNGSRYYDAPIHWNLELWPNGIVLYVICDLYFDQIDAEFIEAIIREITTSTCIKFVPRKTEENYIRIRYNSLTCESKVGPANSGVQILLLNRHCMKRNDILHKLMHVLGFFHKHNRPDRDKHVKIQWENIEDGKQKNFKTVTFSEHADYYNKVYINTTYDFASVMCNPSHGWSKNKKPIIIPRNKSVIIKANGLSELDKLKIGRLYECSAKKEKAGSYCN